MLVIYGVYDLLMSLLHLLLLHYFILLSFGYPLISQFPIIYCVLFVGILHAHINQTMLNFITEFMERIFIQSDILILYYPCRYWPIPKPFLLASLCAAARDMFIIPPNSMPWVVPPVVISDWSFVAWHPRVLILFSLVEFSQERQSPNFYRFLHVDFLVLIRSFFICGIPKEATSSLRAVLSVLVLFLGLNIPLFAMSKCATRITVVLFLYIILLLLNMLCK